MSSTQEEPASIADASALEVTNSTRAGLSFLSLPPEIRNMIYHYVFTPVRDGACLVVRTNRSGDRLDGLRRKRVHCSRNLPHPTCHPKLNTSDEHPEEFAFTDNYVHSNILRTCHNIFEEAMPISLAHMHIAVSSSFGYHDSYKLLRTFLQNMRRPHGAYLSKLTYTSFQHLDLHDDRGILLAKVLKDNDIRIEYLELHESWDDSTDPHLVVNYFVEISDALKHKPATIQWTDRYGFRSYRYESHRIKFNRGIVDWLVESAAAESSNCDTQPPLLRDFLPRYFDQS